MGNRERRQIQGDVNTLSVLVVSVAAVDVITSASDSDLDGLVRTSWENDMFISKEDELRPRPSLCHAHGLARLSGRIGLVFFGRGELGGLFHAVGSGVERLCSPEGVAAVGIVSPATVLPPLTNDGCCN